MKDDAISRQAAIDAMCELMHHWFGGDPKDEVREIKRELEKLPAVQTCEDAVSRKQAIDVLSLGKEMLSRVLDDMDVVGTDREKYSWGLRLIESDIKDIEELPSAQPEPEEDCDTCKHGFFGSRQCDNCRVRYPSHYEREEEQHGSD